LNDENRIERAVSGIALGAVALGCVATLWPFATSLIWALIIVFSTWPLFARLARALGGRKAAAAGVMTLLATAVVIAPLAIMVMSLTDSVTSYAALVRHWLEVGPPGPPSWVDELPLVGARLHDRWQLVATDGASFTAALTPHLGWARDQLLSISASLGGGIARLLLSLVIAFFFYCYGATLATRLDTGLKRVAGPRGRHLAAIVGGTVRGVVYGILGTNLMQAVLAAIGFALAGVPGAVLLGLLCFFLTLIPFAANLIWVPAVIWLVAGGDVGWAIFLAVWNFLVFGPFETLMRAYLVGRTSDLPMILLLLGMFGGLAMFGLLGLLIGPTLLALGYALINEWSREAETEAVVSETATAKAPAC
jgi:predicted PurR-regulated permease PerM